MRKKNGVYDKNGELTPVNWDEALGVMAAQAKKVLKEKGPTALGMFGSGQWTDLGRLRSHQADARGLPLQQSRPERASLHGVSRLRVHAHLRRGRADGML